MLNSHPALIFATALLACGTLLPGCRSTAVESERALVPAAATLPTENAIPAQTVLQARLNAPIGTEHSRPGDRFTVTVLDNLVADTGRVVVPAGAIITGVVTELHESGHVGEQASIGLAFDRLDAYDRSYPIAAEVVATNVEQHREGGDVARGAGVGALAGAALGAILGGGSGALKGGLVGAAGGTLIGLGAGDVQAELPAGSVMTLRLVQPVYLR